MRRHGILLTRDGEYQLCHAEAMVPGVVATEIPTSLIAAYDRVFIGHEGVERTTEARRRLAGYADLQYALHGLYEAARTLL